MGYYTSYDLTTENDEKYSELEMVLSLLTINPDLGDIERDTTFMDILGYDSLKWYNHDNDIRLLSEAYPEVLFTLSGKGEDAENLWMTYYRNGKI